MKRLFVFLLLIVGLSFIVKNTQAQRFAGCDLCGLCQMNGAIVSTPQNWNTCRACLYPSAAPNPSLMDTLKVDLNSNTGPTPYIGHQYTMIGCIKTNFRSFSEPGAAASVVQLLLNIIFVIVGALALLYFIYGSFVILTSQAQPERLNYGKRIVIGAVTGLVFTLLSAFIVNFIASQILKIPGF